MSSFYLTISSLSQVYQLMKHDSYMRFLKSDLYHECLLAEDDERPLPFEDEVTPVETKEEQKKVDIIFLCEIIIFEPAKATGSIISPLCSSVRHAIDLGNRPKDFPKIGTKFGDNVGKNIAAFGTFWKNDSTKFSKIAPKVGAK